MTTPVRSRYASHRFPPEVISHAIWLYFRFPLSLRMIEEMLAACGIIVSHGRVAKQIDGRQWVRPAARTRAFELWAEITGVAAAA
jgi:putative transposase